MDMRRRDRVLCFFAYICQIWIETLISVILVYSFPGVLIQLINIKIYFEVGVGILFTFLAILREFLLIWGRNGDIDFFFNSFIFSSLFFSISENLSIKLLFYGFYFNILWLLVFTFGENVCYIYSVIYFSAIYS